MEEDAKINLDLEYKRYLQIMRPYLEQLLRPDVIDICKAWIQRLSNCKDSEKNLRNKYIFKLCYKLAKGVIDEPFTKFPSNDDLEPLCDDSDSEGSFSEIECLVIDPDNEYAKILYHNLKPPLSVTELLSIASHSNNNVKETSETSYRSDSLASTTKPQSMKIKKETISPAEAQNFNITPIDNDSLSGKLQYRANNVIQKLRQIKQENAMLHREIMLLKEESKLNHEYNNSQENTIKIDNTTSAYMFYQDSNTTLNCLRCKLQEVQDSRNNLIETVGNLQDKLDHFNESKIHEIDELIAKHKLEIVTLKSAIWEDAMSICEKNIASMKKNYEDTIKAINQKHYTEVETLKLKINEINEENRKIIESKDLEICQLTARIENLNIKFSTETNHCDKNMQTERVYELEKRLHKLEKNKNKTARTYEIKIANIQREKYLTECSLQLQLIKQRAQVVSELTDENHTELMKALEKLEGKYKEIIGNVQATAVQRRIQDQVTLESLIKTICDIPQEGSTKNNKALHHQINLANKIESSGNEKEHLIVGNTSFGDESLINSYHLNNEKMNELFERIHVPQKDINNDISKKF